MIVVEVNDLRIIENNQVDGFLIGTSFISSECYMKFTIEEVINFTEKAHKQKKLVFLDATQIFHDQDLNVVSRILKDLDCVDYVLYNDLALMDLIDEKKRFYYSVTYVTNKYDFEIVSEENSFTLVSPTLSFEELKEFRMNEKAFLIAFGTFEIFHSRRPLISNYLNYRKLPIENSKYQVIEEFRNEKYPIVEENGTKIYLNDYYCLMEELRDLSKNLLLKVFDIPYTETTKIIDLYKKAIETNDYTLLQNIKDVVPNLHKGLLYQNSILIKEGKNNA